MARPSSSLLVERRDQILPVLSAAEIDRIRRFGEVRGYRAGEALFAIGDKAPGMFVLLEGTVLVIRRDPLGAEATMAELTAGMFLAEFGQIAGQPALVEAQAGSDVEALVIPRERLRDLIVAEADLGERIMRALILRRTILIEEGAGGPVLVGSATDARIVLLQDFLLRNAFPHQLFDPDREADAQRLLDRFHVGKEDLPIAICPNGTILRDPGEAALARCIGLLYDVDAARLYDVAIIGAGPAGMAAAVYGASEGLAVLLLESRVFGGQASASARIENYLGFPTGISGRALMGRAYAQAQKFGAEMVLPALAEHMEIVGGGFQLTTRDGQRPRARTVVIASGAVYRRPDIPGLDEYEGSGVHYWASPVEARLCAGEEVALVGGGNSAGQAAVYLAGQVRKVHMLVRGASLADSMSHYLVERIAALTNIEVHVQSEVVAIEGERGVLRTVIWRDNRTNQQSRLAVGHLFLFIGADPNPGWLGRCDVALDNRGFVLTGAKAGESRQPLETSLAGVFAIGDVRSGSTKRVAAAVGEGAQVVPLLHDILSSPLEAVES